MSTHASRFFALMIAAAMLAARAAAAQTATEPQVYSACYVPGVGAVYRIKTAGLPQACVGRAHVEFSWNQAGPKGAKGDQGEPGIPGNLALAGKSCPTGFLVGGFDATGTLICRNLAGEAPAAPPPPPPPPHSLAGTWALSPTPSAPCAAGGLLDIRIGEVQTRVNSPGELTAILVTSVNGAEQLIPAFTVSVTEPVTMPIAFASSGTTPVESALVSGTITFGVSGEFTSLSSFTATVQVSASLKLKMNGLPVSCGPVTQAVLGTRSGN